MRKLLNPPAELEGEADLPVAAHLEPLTQPMRRFVREYVQNGGKAEAAAKAAGYSPKGARSYGYRLLEIPNVISAIYAESVQQLGAAVPGALSTVKKLVGSAKSEYVRLQASQDVLDRAGFSAPKRVDVSGGLSVTIDLS